MQDNRQHGVGIVRAALAMSGLYILIGCTLVHCQERPKLDKTEFALLAADAGSRGLDVYSTHKMLESGHQEMFIPYAIASRPAAMAALEAGDVAGVWWLSRRLGAHHRKLAHVLTLVDIGQDVPWAIHNLYLSGHPVGTLKTPKLPIVRPQP